MAATGRGLAVEERRAWKGFWNENLIETSQRLFADPEVVTVLLTGRSTAFIETVNRMLDSRNLKFHLVVLKPKKGRGMSNSTIKFKYAFLDEMLRLGESIEEVEMYEDRPLHRDAFEDYLRNWRRIKATATEEETVDGIRTQSLELTENSDLIGLKAFKVHFVAMPFAYLDEGVEESLIGKMIEETNEIDLVHKKEQYSLERKLFSLGYLLEQHDFQKLFDTYLPVSMDHSPSEREDWRTLRQPSVFIHFKADSHILNKVGGIGKRVEFEATHLGVSDKVLALSIVPIASYHEVMDGKGEIIFKSDSYTRYWSKNNVPVLVLATRNGGKPIDANHLDQWALIPKSVENRRFTTRVAVRQELSMIVVPKAEKKAQESTAERNDMSTSPRRRASHDSNNYSKGHGDGRTAPNMSSRNRRGSSEYGRGGSRRSNTRNAFGYSLE